MIKPEPELFKDYRRYLKIRVDALNHALAGIPEDRVRHHFCWGSWHGAHTHDLPMREIIDLVFQVRAQTYSFEAGNVRHEHEVDDLERYQAARWKDHHAGRSQATQQTLSSILNLIARRIRNLRQTRLGERMYWREPIAGWVRACTMISFGRSFRLWWRERVSRRKLSGRVD